MSASYEDHVKLLGGRRKYHIEKPEGDVDYARTKGADVKDYTAQIFCEGRTISGQLKYGWI